MWPTISVEGTDSFDALSRSYSYTFHRPIAYLFYVIVAGVIGLLAGYVVYYFVEWTTELAFWSASWGASPRGFKRSSSFAKPSRRGRRRNAAFRITPAPCSSAPRYSTFGSIASYF